MEDQFDDIEIIPDGVKLGLKDPCGLGIDIDIVVGETDPKKVWDQRDKFLKDIENSKEVFNKLSSEEKQSVLRCVRSGLGRLYDHVDTWVPEAFIDHHPGGSTLTVYFTMVFADLAEEDKRFEIATSKRIQSTKDDVKSLLVGD